MKKVLTIGIAVVAMCFGLHEGRAQDGEINALKAQIDALKVSISRERSIVAGEQAKASKMESDARLARSFQKASDSLLTDSREGRLTSSDLESSLIRNHLLLEAYRQSFEIKSDLEKGEGLSDFSLRNGVAFTGVVFNGSDAGGVHIIHSNGVAKLRVEDLPPGIAEHFRGPPSDRSTVDVAALLAQKPDALKPRSQVYADAAAERQEQQEKHHAERVIQQKKNQKIEAQIAALRVKVRELESNARSQAASKRSLVNEQTSNRISGRTTKSQADMNQLLKEYDQKLAAIKAAQAKLESEISLLQSQRPY